MGSKFGVISHSFPSLGPAILISMTYIDLGKWVAAIEGGARFGFDLVLPVLIFNCIAILCQYLSAGISMVTGKNLAEVCSEEYCRFACLLLGVLAEVSMIISDFTMVFGIAHGLALLFDMDFFSCIYVAIIGAFLLPFLLILLDNRKSEAVFVSIGGLALLFYVLGVLISQPEVPVITNEVFPKLTGENAYSLMALLGANIMVHNFYVHSAIVQQQRRLSNVSVGALFHDHFFAILFIFTGIFLVNYVLITSAAAVFGNADLLAPNFQDLSIVMEQIFKNPVAPVALFLVLFFSCQITAFTRNIGEQVILQHFFGTKLSVLAHHMLAKSLAAMLAFFCARIAGAEGIYQSCMVCQITLGMLLPSSSIPLFRVASSRSLMGAFKTSWYTEILVLLAFLGMLGANIFFVAVILFDNSIWIANLRESNGTSTIILYAFLLLGFISICVTFYLAVTPLKSASNKSDMQIYASNSQKDFPALSEGLFEDSHEMIKYDEVQEYVAEDTVEKSLESPSDKSIIEYNPDMPVSIVSDVDLQHSAYGSNSALNITSAFHLPVCTTPNEEGPLDIEYKSSAQRIPCEVTITQAEFEESVATVVTSETDICTDKDNDERDALQNESLKGSIPPLNSEGPRSPNIVKEMSKDGGNSSGSLPKLLGLGRAGRRQFTVILDEFWGNLFDFHGKLTQDASSKRLDILLGLDLKMASSGKADGIAAESSKVLFPDADKGQCFQPDLRDYSSPRQKKVQGADFPLGIQVGTSSWSQNMQQAEARFQNSCSNIFGPPERSYSSLHLPLSSDDRDYQPATIHGYQIASYLRGISSSRSPYATCSPNLPPTSKFSTSYVSSLRDQVMYSHNQNELGSLGTSSLQNPALSRINMVQERPHYEPALMEPSEHSVSSAYTKKYHSSPDISAIIALARNSYLNEGKQSIPIGPRTSFDKILSEQSRYLNPLSRGASLAFDGLSPSKVHQDVFPLQQGLNQETKSLFSRQPFEELFGMVRRDQSGGGQGAVAKPSITAEETFPYAESEAKFLHSLRICIKKLLNLDGSDWLFSQSGGPDEQLIDRVAVAEKCLHLEMNEISLLPNCGDGCVWRAALVVSFGVWCIRRTLELSLVESRPELWGKYTYVLNRLQGIIEPAFCKPRQPLKSCTCIDMSVKCLTNFNSQLKNWTPPVMEKHGGKSLTNASMILELIKDVETAVSGRKGRTGTAAGDVAFPKGKENLASVLKRYKRRLSSKPQGSPEGTSLRKATSSSSGL